MRTKKVKSAGRFGCRYGRKIRLKVTKVDATSKKYHNCPSCKEVKVKRLSAGIWQCRKCDAKFAGGAYSPIAKIEPKFTAKTEIKTVGDFKSKKEVVEESNEQL